MKNMLNIRALLRLVGASVLTTVAATSVVACGKKKADAGISMDSKVAADFGFVDKDNKSLVVTTIGVKEGIVSWTSTQLTGITGANLLETGETTVKAKSVAGGDFLVNVLKLTATGKGADRTFKIDEAKAITMTVKAWAPTMAAVETKDFAVTGGTATVQFMAGDKAVGSEYSLNILGKPADGVVLSVLPAAADITIANFNIPEFKVGQSKTGIEERKDLTSNLITDAAPGKDIKSIVELIKQGDLAVKVTKVTAAGTEFAAGDSLEVQITIGTVTFATEYTLTLAE